MGLACGFARIFWSGAVIIFFLLNFNTAFGKSPPRRLVFENGNAIELDGEVGITLIKGVNATQIFPNQKVHVRLFETTDSSFINHEGWEDTSINQDRSVQTYFMKKEEPVRSTVVDVEGHLFVIGQMGTIAELKLPAPPIEEHARGHSYAKKLTVRRMMVQEKQYMVISAKLHSRGEENSINDGVIYLVREDGEWTAMNRGVLDPDTIQKLSVSGSKIVDPTYGSQFDVNFLNLNSVKGRVPNIPLHLIPVPSSSGKGELKDAIEVVKEFGRPLQLSELENSFPLPDSKDEILNLRIALGQPKSVLISGSGGVGKYELLRSLQKAILLGEIPEIPPWTKLIDIDPIATEGGTLIAGMYEARLTAMDQAAKENNLIYCVRDFHRFVGGGVTIGNPLDFFVKIRPYLKDPRFKFLGTVSNDDLVKYLNPLAGFTQAFASYKMRDLKASEYDDRMVGWMEHYKHPVLPKALRRRVLYLSDQLSAVGDGYTKAISFLEYIYSSFDVLGISPLAATEEDINAAALRMYKPQEPVFRPELRDDFIKRVEKHLDDVILGLNDAKREIINRLKIKITGLNGKEGPGGNIIFAGPRGVAKTQLAESLAEAMSVEFKRIPMSASRDLISIKKEIAETLQIYPDAVILIDEIEKAPLFVQNELLDVMDRGTFKVRMSSSESEREIRTSQAFFIYATNAGADYLGSVPADGSINLKVLIETMVRDNFSKYLLDRSGATVVGFRSYSKVDLKAILKLKLDAKISEYKKNHAFEKIWIQNEEEFLTELVEKFHDPTGGARISNSKLGHSLELALAELRLADPNISSCALTLKATGEKWDSGFDPAKKQIGYH